MPEKKPIYYPDTSYIIGRFKKKARELKDKRHKKKRKTSIKVNGASKDLAFNFLISQITEMEIKKTLMNEEGLTFSQANKCFNEVLGEMPGYVKIVEKDLVVTSAVCNKVCEKRIDLGDILHILVAAKLKLYIVTKEKKKLKKWKEVYDNVLSDEEFQKKIKT